MASDLLIFRPKVYINNLQLSGRQSKQDIQEKRVEHETTYILARTTETSGSGQLGSVIEGIFSGLGLFINVNGAKNIVLVLCLIAWRLCSLPAAAQSAPGDEHWDFRFGRPGANGAVLAIAVQGNEAYVGGTLITTVGNVVATNIAKWDGQNWSALGSGISAAGQAMVFRITLAPNGELYAGGSFTAAGGIAATNIARWNGVSWSPLGGGVGGGVIALAFSGNQLYAGGAFTNVSTSNIKALARWDGTNWWAVGSGVAGGTNNSVNALLADGNNLYVGGTFTNAGGLDVNRIAKWDGTSWSALGSGLTGPNVTVTAILKSGTNLYVAGSFTNAGGVTASNIARWDGARWAPLGGGIGKPVSALAVNGPFVFAEAFTNAGGVTVTNVARWDGTDWSNIGGLTSSDPASASGTYDYALAVDKTAVCWPVDISPRQGRRPFRAWPGGTEQTGAPLTRTTVRERRG